MPEDVVEIKQQSIDHFAIILERLRDPEKREGMIAEMGHLRRNAEQEGKHPLDTEGWELQFIDVPFNDGTRRFVGFAKWEGGKLIRMQHGSNGELLIPEELYENAVEAPQGQAGAEAEPNEYMVPKVDADGMMQGVIRLKEAPQDRNVRLAKIAQHKQPKAGTILSMPQAPLAQKAA